MKKFSFTLEKVLNYRLQILELEKNKLGMELAKENELRRKLEDARNFENLQYILREQKLTAGTNILELQQHKFQIESLRHQQKQLKIQLENQHRAVEVQITRVTEADKAYKLLEKLKEKKLTRHEKDQLKETEKQIEELAVTRSHTSALQPAISFKGS